MCKTIIKSLLFLLFAFLLWLAAGTTTQAEMMYQISESQLTTLEQNLQTLQMHNEEKQKLLTEQQKQLTIADQQLAIANKQLAKSKALNDQTQKSLQKANQSLTQLEKEAQHKIQVKTRQRNLWIGISALAIYACVKK